MFQRTHLKPTFNRLFSAGRSRSTISRARRSAPLENQTISQTNGANTTAAVPTPTTPPTSAWDTAKKYFRPALSVIALGYFASRMLKGGNDDDDDFINKQMKNKPTMKLKVERVDDKISDYDAAFIAATKDPKAGIAHKLRYRQLKLLDSHFALLTDDQIEALIIAGKKARQANEDYAQISETARLLIMKNNRTNPLAVVATQDPAKQGAASPEETTPGPQLTANGQVVLTETKDELLAQDLLQKAVQAKLKNEMLLLKSIDFILSQTQKSQLLKETNPNIATFLLSNLLKLDSVDHYDFMFNKVHRVSLLPTAQPPRVYVLNFKGDIQASQVEKMREEITGILSFADRARGDKVVVALHSGGGAVTGYGLAAAQLERIKSAGLPLIVCVDEVAASGGYMMASVADKIIASPFALLGSVGVIATIPNFSNRLQREGVEVEDVTAGKFKRTMTPYKKVNNEDRNKMKSDIEEVFVIFKDHLKRTRPSLDVESIATGETWYGPAALKRGLCDELATSDDYILNCRKEGAEVYTVQLKMEKGPGGLADILGGDAAMEGENILMAYFRRYVTNAMMSLFMNAMKQQGGAGGSFPSLEGMLNGEEGNKYMGNGDIPINQRIMALDENIVNGRSPRF